jgi:hypothetical protein
VDCSSPASSTPAPSITPGAPTRPRTPFSGSCASKIEPNSQGRCRRVLRKARASVGRPARQAGARDGMNVEMSGLTWPERPCRGSSYCPSISARPLARPTKGGGSRAQPLGGGEPGSACVGSSACNLDESEGVLREVGLITAVSGSLIRRPGRFRCCNQACPSVQWPGPSSGSNLMPAAHVQAPTRFHVRRGL